MGLYTFFVEKNGATSIEQFPGADIEEAAALWHQHSQYVPGLVDPADPDPTPVAETRNVWCLSGIDGADDFYLVHVVGPLAEETPSRPAAARPGNGIRLLDRTLVRQGFGKFARSSKIENGRSVRFEYPSGARYDIPVEFLVEWFPREEAAKAAQRRVLPTVERVRTASEGDLVRVHLSDGKVLEVAWDTVLMACEPLYEHYGGLTEESRKLTRAGEERYGSLRIESGAPRDTRRIGVDGATRRALLRLSTWFAAPLLETRDGLVISEEKDVERHWIAFPGDPTGFEAFVTHVHLEDLLASGGSLRRRDWLAIGWDLMQVWGDRLRPRLRGRSVLFYLGGSRGVILRFHVAREGCADWLDWTDKDFLTREKLSVYRLTETDLVKLA